MDLNFPYTDVDLTEQVNRMPNTFGLLNAMDLFPTEGMASRYVEIRFEDGVLVVLSAEEPGAPGKPVGRETGKTIVLKIPHFPLPDTILPQDLQGILDQEGKVKAPKKLAKEVAKRLRNIRTNHAITREFVRLGALKGLIKDGTGRTLYNLFTVFDIVKKTVDFTLGTPGTDVIAKCEEVTDHIRNNLKGETMSSVEVLCDGVFFNKFVQHAKVEKFWLQTQAAQTLVNYERDRLGGNWGRVFEFQGLMLREYKGSLPVRDAESGVISSQVNIAANTGHAFPVGTQSTFRTWDGPAHHISMVNQPGQEIVITAEPRKHGEGIDFKSQSNVLAVVKRPEVLVEVSTSN